MSWSGGVRSTVVHVPGSALVRHDSHCGLGHSWKVEISKFLQTPDGGKRKIKEVVN